MRSPERPETSRQQPCPRTHRNAHTQTHTRTHTHTQRIRAASTFLLSPVLVSPLYLFHLIIPTQHLYFHSSVELCLKLGEALLSQHKWGSGGGWGGTLGGREEFQGGNSVTLVCLIYLREVLKVFFFLLIGFRLLFDRLLNRRTS